MTDEQRDALDGIRNEVHESLEGPSDDVADEPVTRLQDRTVAELRGMVAANGLSVRTKATKGELLAALGQS
jgi:hypothetical protein